MHARLRAFSDGGELRGACARHGTADHFSADAGDARQEVHVAAALAELEELEEPSVDARRALSARNSRAQNQ
jgi:hypothetical protein